MLEANIRLDPFQPLIFSAGCMGLAYYMLRRYGEAVGLLRGCVSRQPHVHAPHLLLASAYAQLGQPDEGKAGAPDVLRINPSFTIEQWKRVAVLRDLKYAERLMDGLRKAGLPET